MYEGCVRRSRLKDTSSPEDQTRESQKSKFFMFYFIVKIVQRCFCILVRRPVYYTESDRF